MTATTSTRLANPPPGCAVKCRASAGLVRDIDQRLGCRHIARPSGDEQQVAGTDGLRRHVGPDGDVAPHVEQPHREATHLQALAAAAEHDDPLGGDDRLDQRIGGVVRQLGEDNCCDLLPQRDCHA